VKALSGKDFCNVLERHGWELKRISGSYHHYGKPGRREVISVPVHGNVTLKVGMQAYFMKVAGLTERDL
jgi:predicted RNA binding protein YcfA (HicA-like mRNA interferase family)